jgi:hypothetical protein
MKKPLDFLDKKDYYRIVLFDKVRQSAQIYFIKGVMFMDKPVTSVPKSTADTDKVSFTTLKTESVKTDPVKSDPLKTDPVKTESVKSDPVKTDPFRSAPVTTSSEFKPEPRPEAAAAPKSSGKAYPKIVKPEKDLTPKYTDADAAVATILRDGDFYEDYARGEKARLLESKALVLAAIAQNADRFYAPETPKPADWLDEEFFTARLSLFFDAQEESLDTAATNELADSLLHHLRKWSFTAEAYNLLTKTAQQVAKINVSRIKTAEAGDRIKTSLERYNQQFNIALDRVKAAQEEADRVAAAKAKRLADTKTSLNSLIDGMQFNV